MTKRSLGKITYAYERRRDVGSKETQDEGRGKDTPTNDASCAAKIKKVLRKDFCGSARHPTFLFIISFNQLSPLVLYLILPRLIKQFYFFGYFPLLSPNFEGNFLALFLSPGEPSFRSET